MNGIETQVGNHVDIIRVDLLSSIGRQATRQFGVYIVPVTLLFDDQGALLARQTSIPDSDRLVNYIEMHGRAS